MNSIEKSTFWVFAISIDIRKRRPIIFSVPTFARNYALRDIQRKCPGQLLRPNFFSVVSGNEVILIPYEQYPIA
jgi:hypothetical protein